jgi:TPR repeat protein
MSITLLVTLLVAQTAFVPLTPEERYLADLRARIARGDVEAEVALGNLYESGESVLPLDPAQAAAWYRRAADKGHAGAQLNLAMMYLEGQGVPRDVRQAIAWYERAADRGDAVAKFSLGSIYETGADHVARDATEAANWYRKAAEQGLVNAQYRLGLMYRDGRGVARDRALAIAWLRKAADQGEADAQIELGILLSSGRAAPADVVEAHTWLNLAASRWKNEAKRVQAARLRNRIEQTMTPAQRTEAYRRATEWQDAHAWRR